MKALSTIGIILLFTGIAIFILLPLRQRVQMREYHIDIADYHEKQLGRLNDSLVKYIRDKPKFREFSDSFTYHERLVWENVFNDK